MLIGAIQSILILVTFLAAVAGTVSNPSGRIKALIIGLALVTSIGTVIEAVDSARKGEIDERLIASLIHFIEPPEYFSHDFVKIINRNLEQSGEFVSRQNVFDDTRERILTLANSADDSLSGILFLSRKHMNPILYKYASGSEFTDSSSNLLISDLLNRSWSDCIDHWIECFGELSAISKLAMMEYSPIDVSGTTPNLNDDLRFSLTSWETHRGNPIRIQFNRKFIESLYKQLPGKRGLKILMAGQKQIIDQL